jgi:hypothetical protein
MKLPKLVQAGIIVSALVTCGAGVALVGMGRMVGLPYAIVGALIAIAARGGWSAVADDNAPAELSHLSSDLVAAARDERPAPSKK